MKLFYYSNRLHTYVEMKWAVATFAFAGILIATIIFFGFAMLHQSNDRAFKFPSEDTLAAENDSLRQQLRLMLPHLSDLEEQERQLKKRANQLHMLLLRRGPTTTWFRVSRVRRPVQIPTLRKRQATLASISSLAKTTDVEETHSGVQAGANSLPQDCSCTDNHLSLRRHMHRVARVANGGQAVETTMILAASPFR